MKRLRVTRTTGESREEPSMAFSSTSHPGGVEKAQVTDEDGGDRSHGRAKVDMRGVTKRFGGVADGIVALDDVSLHGLQAVLRKFPLTRYTTITVGPRKDVRWPRK
jgi:hypothetical protein